MEINNFSYRQWDFSNELISPVKVQQFPNAQYGLGSTVWDAALVLCSFLESERGRAVVGSSCRCLELGSGTGIVSIVAATLDSTRMCTASDLGDCVALISRNIELNGTVNCTAVEVDWTVDPPEDLVGTDWVLCADCVYDLSCVSPLLRTIAALSPSKGLIVSNELRLADGNALAEATFRGMIQDLGYVGNVVPKETFPPEWRCDDILVTVYTQPAP